jgi:hypothetical protein
MVSFLPPDGGDAQTARGSFLPPDGGDAQTARGLTRFARLSADDLFSIKVQPSQRLVLGIDPVGDRDHAEILADQPVAWTAWRGETILACFGIAEVFAGAHGVAWSMLAEGIGASHLAVTRFARKQLDECGLRRVELIARGSAAQRGYEDAKSEWQLDWQRKSPTPEYRWAVALGFEPMHVLRHYGAADETCVLFERFPAAETLRKAA